MLVNRALAAMLGYSQQELLDLVAQGSMTRPDDRSVDQAQVQQVVDGRQDSVQWAKRYLHRDGHVVHARVSASLLRAADATPQYMIAQIEDITARRGAEQALAQAQAAALEQERRTAEQLQQALDGRVVIEQAKGVLAATYGISVEEAFQRLRG